MQYLSNRKYANNYIIFSYFHFFKEEEEKRQKEIEEGTLVVDWNMDTWNHTNIQTRSVNNHEEKEKDRDGIKLLCL